MNAPNGLTRTHIGTRHALIAPDGHVKSNVPGIAGAAVIVLISEAMGARFSQLLVTFETGGRAHALASDVETVGYFMAGGGTVSIGDQKERCGAGGFFFAPAGQDWSIGSVTKGTQVTLFQKRFVTLADGSVPSAVIGDAKRVKAEPFLGDPDARLQVLLPEDSTFDLAVNIFTYKPGATLPFVETHIMEHGLIMLGGQGVYRLEDSWYPVAKGDVIWMAPYCRQWFVAAGKEPASYLYYKDVNRPAM